MMEPEKKATRKLALDRALQQIEKSYGKGAVMQLDKMNFAIEGISTGALSLDLALGGKGLPRGRIIELFGPESSGKTTLALHCIAAAQQDDGVCAFVDAEHAMVLPPCFDPFGLYRSAERESTLSPQGPTYTALGRFPFSGTG